MGKMITIVEFPAFLNQIGKCIESDERNDLLDYLARNPEAGNEIPGTGGVRKLRWFGKGKGKRGGLRVIYYFYNDIAPVFLLTVYGKGEREDLSSDQKRKLTKLSEALKAECKALRNRHHG